MNNDSKPADEDIYIQPVESDPLQVMVDEHNKLRALHCNTPDLVYDEDISIIAQRIADKKVFAHSALEERNGYGENLAWNNEPTIQEALVLGIKQFYDEIEFYDYDAPSYSGPNGEKTGHFTQLVWKGSSKVGVGWSRMEMYGKEGWFIVIQYDPSGNFNNDFVNNVMPLRSAGECPAEKTMIDDTAENAISRGLEMINELREKHCDTPPMALDGDLLQTADFVAKKHGENSIWAHSQPEDRLRVYLPIFVVTCFKHA